MQFHAMSIYIRVYMVLYYLLQSLAWSRGTRFKAEEHIPEIRDFLAAGAAQVQRTVGILDVFGASGRMAGRWTQRNLQARSFDIKVDKKDDITSREGFFRLAAMGLMLIPGALLFCSPPCSDLAKQGQEKG